MNASIKVAFVSVSLLASLVGCSLRATNDEPTIKADSEGKSTNPQKGPVNLVYLDSFQFQVNPDPEAQVRIVRWEWPLPEGFAPDGRPVICGKKKKTCEPRFVMDDGVRRYSYVCKNFDRSDMPCVFPVRKLP